ncbi:MAG: DUF499 domain-containing protein [Candidatus Obscuribacterales bacterium]|nr:DUF499 domain-containing protein [Candidatus Obscuribacterales bacterium]
MSKSIVTPWKKTCLLRQEIRARHLKASDFAVDLHKVVNGWPSGATPFYCDPVQFFSTTYATENLRQFCKVVLRRLSNESDAETVINVTQTFGGGKSHTLTALYYLATLGKKIPFQETSVKSILNHSGLKTAPTSRVAAVSFDKVDWITGCEVKAPDGEIRAFRMPWNLIAWQLLGKEGLEILERDESKPDHNTPPADTLWAKIFAKVEKEGHGCLILIDEFLMWAHDAASSGSEGATDDRGPAWFERLKNFFQRLAQAVESSERSCMVVSLLATDPEKNDELGKAILDACNNGLNRQASIQSPIEKDDLAELLRRRMFQQYPENRADRDAYVHAFWQNMAKVDPVRAKLPGAREKIADAYPFHPDLLDRFFGKWTELAQFQRTRGVLQTFAMALRDAESWDDSPLVGPQVFLAEPGKDGLSEALLKLAEIAKDSDRVKNPQWPTNLKTELPRSLNSQQVDAGTLTSREIETACVTTFIYSQPIGEQAELGELRWLLAPAVELPAVLNNGLISWAKISWYLEECEALEAASGVPKFWRLGPKPNLNQLHDSYKRQALKHARTRFDEIAQNKCTPLYEGCNESGIKLHKLPHSPSDVEDDGQFRLVILGSAFNGTVGDLPLKSAADYIRQHSSASDVRNFQNIVLIVTPSGQGLRLAEEQIANWMAWEEIEGSAQYRDLENFQQQTVKTRKKDSLKDAITAVKNAYELVLYIDKIGAIQSKKITLGAQSLLEALKQEKDLRIFDEKIDASTIMPGGLYPIWPAGVNSVRVDDLYQEFGKQPALPKLLREKTVLNTIEDAVKRGLLALRCPRADGSEVWFWRGNIDMPDWAHTGEAHLPSSATLNALSPAAVVPGTLPGLWPSNGSGAKVSTIFSWFDGAHYFDEVTEPGYPPEPRPIPTVQYTVVKGAISKAIEQGALWLVFGTDSVFAQKPTELQLDPDAMLYTPPRSLAAIDLLPGNLPDAWTQDSEPQTTVEKVYASLKIKEGRPWPGKKFIETINASLGQGFMRRVSGNGQILDLEKDGNVALIVKSDQPAPPTLRPEPITAGGRRGTSMAKLSVAEIQDFADTVSDVMKTLAGCEPEIEVRVTIQSKNPADLEAANKILENIKKDWKF